MLIAEKHFKSLRTVLIYESETDANSDFLKRPLASHRYVRPQQRYTPILSKTKTVPVENLSRDQRNASSQGVRLHASRAANKALLQELLERVQEGPGKVHS